MAEPTQHAEAGSLEVFLLGQIDLAVCLRLQQRLVYELSGRDDGQMALLVCEHPPVISVGRQGSRGHVRLGSDELARRSLDVLWVNRGGGCLLHAPGQLAVYPIVPLTWHGLSVGQYLARLEAGLLATLADMGVTGQTRPGWRGVWARSGQLAHLGVAVRNWTTYFGAYLNVDPPLRQLRAIDSDPVDGSPASSLAAERRQPVNMAGVRATIIRHLATAFGCRRYHIYTGHPLLASFPHARVEKRA